MKPLGRMGTDSCEKGEKEGRSKRGRGKKKQEGRRYTKQQSFPWRALGGKKKNSQRAGGQLKLRAFDKGLHQESKKGLRWGIEE